MNMNLLNTPVPMDFKSENLPQTWNKWKQIFNIFMVANEKIKKSEELKIAIFLNLIGQEGIDIYNTFNKTGNEKLEDIILLFDKYCTPRKNTVFSRFKFFTRVQHEGETIDQYLTDLKIKASACEFGDQLESLLRDRIVLGVLDKKLQENLLKEAEITLEKAMNICRASEMGKQHIEEILTNKETNNNKLLKIEAMNKRTNKNNFNNKQFNSKSDMKKEDKPFNNYGFSKPCSRCGIKHEPKHCPAYGKICGKCKGKNHFSKVCKKKFIRSVEDDASSLDESDDFKLDNIIEIERKINSCEWKEELIINDTKIIFKIDTGAECNIFPKMILII